MAIKKDNYLTKEQIEAGIKQGLDTYEALGAALDRSAKSMKKIMDGFGIILEEPEPIKMNNFSASDEDEWDQLYKDYDFNSQAQYVIAECRVKNGMSVAQARQYMKDNFRYNVAYFNGKAFNEGKAARMAARRERAKKDGYYF